MKTACDVGCGHGTIAVRLISFMPKDSVTGINTPRLWPANHGNTQRQPCLAFDVVDDYVHDLSVVVDAESPLAGHVDVERM